MSKKKFVYFSFYFLKETFLKFKYSIKSLPNLLFNCVEANEKSNENFKTESEMAVKDLGSQLDIVPLTSKHRGIRVTDGKVHQCS